jgi:hypothetical protein
VLFLPTTPKLKAYLAGLEKLYPGCCFLLRELKDDLQPGRDYIVLHRRCMSMQTGCRSTVFQPPTDCMSQSAFKKKLSRCEAAGATCSVVSVDFKTVRVCLYIQAQRWVTCASTRRLDIIGSFWHSCSTTWVLVGAHYFQMRREQLIQTKCFPCT